MSTPRRWSLEIKLAAVAQLEPGRCRAARPNLVARDQAPKVRLLLAINPRYVKLPPSSLEEVELPACLSLGRASRPAFFSAARDESSFCCDGHSTRLTLARYEKGA
jgi:hypothetical protein